MKIAQIQHYPNHI